MRCLIALGVTVMVAAGCAESQRSTAQFLTQHDWVGRGEWIRADLHMHTRFSDGAHTPEDVVARAVEHGCQAIAITDHGDRQLGAATPRYGVAIELARVANPGVIVIAGLEWNVPPDGGREHATVLMPDGPTEVALLSEFKRQFDDFDREDKPDAGEALKWLARATAVERVPPVIIYNHPSRSGANSSKDGANILAWRTVNELVIGFEGAPGHQGREPIGSYKGPEMTIDRWDPIVAEPGGGWDALLRQGLDVRGAIASSDFHDANPGGLNDFWPCQFAETWLYVPEKTPAGVLRALAAGASVGVHGRIARDIEFTVTHDGLARPAVTGEVVQLPVGSSVEATVRMTVPETDWQNQPNHVDVVEFIVVTADDVQVRSQKVAGTGSQTVTERLEVGPNGLVVRVRGRRVVPDGPDLMFYTNAIRIAPGR